MPYAAVLPGRLGHLDRRATLVLRVLLDLLGRLGRRVPLVQPELRVHRARRASAVSRGREAFVALEAFVDHAVRRARAASVPAPPPARAARLRR